MTNKCTSAQCAHRNICTGAQFSHHITLTTVMSQFSRYHQGNAKEHEMQTVCLLILLQFAEHAFDTVDLTSACTQLTPKCLWPPI